MSTELTERKQIFLEALQSSLGIIAAACKACGISRRTFYNWHRDDEAFRTAVDEITEMQLDYVEDRLLKLIKIGDTTATIFYLKTKGKKRGYSEVYQVHDETERKQPPVFPLDECAEDIRARLRAVGKYDAQFEPMITSAALLYGHIRMLHQGLMDEGYTLKIHTRDGNVREEPSPKAEMMRKYAVDFVNILTKLGLSPDSKQPKSIDDDVDSITKYLDADD